MSRPPQRSVIQPHPVMSTSAMPLGVDTTYSFLDDRDEALKRVHPADDDDQDGGEDDQRRPEVSCDAMAVAPFRRNDGPLKMLVTTVPVGLRVLALGK